MIKLNETLRQLNDSSLKCQSCFLVETCMLTVGMSQYCAGPFNDNKHREQLLFQKSDKKKDSNRTQGQEKKMDARKSFEKESMVMVADCDIKVPLTCNYSSFVENNQTSQQYIVCYSHNERRLCPYKCGKWGQLN